MRKLYFTVVLTLCTFLTFAQTQWIGPAGGDWSTAANWTNGVPAAGNDALITGGSDIAINNPIIIDFGVTNFSGDIAVNADVFNIGNFINSGGNMSLANGALFLNSGAVTFTNDGPFSNDGTFLNYGTFQQNGNGVFDNNPTGVFINYGNITNVGNFNNNGTVENFGTLTNASTFVNNALTRNCGSFINTFVSTLDNNASATFHNKAGAQLFIDKDFNNAGTLDDDGSTTVNASGVVNNTGTININGLFQVSTIFNNDGTVNVAGNYKSNFGTTNNNSTWNNIGRTENLGTFNNNAGSSLANTGTLMNASCANFFQRSNGTINSMTNDGVLYELGGTVNVTGASQGVALQNANTQPTPVLICRDIQIQTDENGEVTITAGDVLVDGDAKYCNIVTLEVTQTDFTCADLGVNPVTVTLTDGFNNSNTCTVDVTVVERSPNPCNTSFLNYCASSSSNAGANEYIRVVSLEAINNVTGRSGYTDYTAQVASLEFGNFYDLEIEKRGANQTSTTSVWIDWNNDGDFTDAGENVLTETSNVNPAFLSGVINVPGTALPGTTRMRVSMTRGDTAPTPCATLPNGEVEDYTIMIVSNITIQNCVGDIVVSAAPGATEQVVGWIPPKGFSTCQNSVDIELVSGLPAGSAFPVGTTTNTLRFFDGCGGELECSFDVTVNPTPVTFSLACRDDIILTASAGLGGAIANWTAPFPNATCPQGVNLPTQTVGPNQGDFLPIGTRATVCYESTDNCGNTDNCCFELFVTDPAETLTFDNCPSVITVDGTPGAAGTVVTYPTFTATSSCAAGGLNIILQDGLPSGSIFPNGNTTVTYRATDDCNSAALCSFIVTVNPTPSEVTVNCPNDIVVDVNPGSPSQVVTYPAVTATSDCPGAIQITQTQGLPSGNAFPLGNTVVQYMVNDACGDMENCTFNVTLNTVAASTTINCPNDITVNAAAGDVGAVVTWTTPTASSDCFTGNANVTLVSALSSGDQFPLGTQEVIYFASDDCGTSDGCSFFVTVEPTQANLNLNCRNNIVRNINVGAANPTVSWAAATGTTTCGGNVNITQIAGPTAGSAFAPGATTITYRGTDNCGNVEICSFDVIVNVNTPADDPEITVNCLNDINVTAAPGQTTASVGFDVPTATTTCNAGGNGGGGNGGSTGGSPDVCTQRTASNTTQCNGIQKGMWLDFQGLENNYSLSNGQFTEFEDGTATFTGSLTNLANSAIQFDVVSFFSHRRTSAPTGSPKANGCVNPSTSQYYYYTRTYGTLTGKNAAAGAKIRLTRAAESFQLGAGGDVVGNSSAFGASGWLHMNIVSQPTGALHLTEGTESPDHDADINIRLSGSSTVCRKGTQGLCGDVPTSITGFTYRGIYNGSRYYISNNAQSYNTSKNLAEAAGGNMVAINSQEENDYVASIITSDIWMGFNDINSEGNWTWTSGDPVTYTNWGAGEPNNSGDEDFGQFRRIGLWNDNRSGNLKTVLEIRCPDYGAPTCNSISENISGYTFIGEFEDSKYFVANSATSWTTAQTNAVAAGGHLASVTSQAENDFINNNATASAGSFWIGLQNVNNTATFQWVNGEPVSYTNWNAGEPNETHQQVAARLIDGSGTWTDRVPTNLFNGVLEIECGSGGTACSRVTSGLEALYDFKDGSGNIVKDVSGVGTPLNLTINNPGNTNWLTGGCGLSINANTTIVNSANESKITNATQASNAITMEAWVKPSNTTQTGPSRLMTISESVTNRNATLGQSGASYSARLRTNDGSTTNNGIPTVIGGNVQTQLQHVVYTRASSGIEKIYVDGVEVYSGTRAGNLSNWASNYKFAIANEVSGDRSWLGEFYLAAVYSKALSAAEVTQNFQAGACCGGNGGSSDATVTQVAGLAPNTNFPVGTTTVVYEVTDDCGNTAYCEFDVTVNQPNSAIALNNCPTDITVTAAAGATSAVANFTAPTATSDCTQGNVVVSQIGGFASGQAFPVGQTTVSYRAVDGCGNEQFCSFFVIVEATAPPATEITVNCPANIQIDAAAGANSASTTFAAPTATTTCNGNVNITQIGGLPSGSDFPIGTTVIFYRLADECGSVESCAFNVRVDPTPASISITCPANVSVDAAPDAEYATATFGNATATSDCFTGSETITQIGGLPSGSLFPVGNSVVFFKATDACGNFAVCNFLITVNATPITNLSECINAGGDADGDGVCADVDCDDNNPLVSQAGDSCNDGNPATSNDVIQADCSCAGVIVYDCPALQANIGDACDDGNPNTTEDTVDTDCSCIGATTFDCPSLSANIGDACDDGNANTNNDQVQADCSCAGTVIPPTFDCPALSANIGDACDDGNANTSNDQVQADCSCAGTVNPPTFDCPALSANVGDACDDGNANTTGDSVQADCTCAGTPVQTGCTATYTLNGLDIDFSNVDAPISTVKVFDNTFATVFACDNFGGTACTNNFTVTVPSAGTYFIQIQTYQDWATNLCDVFDTVELGGTPPVYDCPALTANIGDACNDGDSNTANDVVQADCSCAGTPVGTFDCPALSANIGDACDDGNSNTNNDTVQSDCTCSGTPVSTTCDVTYEVNGMDITISNINAPISAVKVLTANYQTIFSCDDWTTACANVETITVPSAGDYLIQVQTYQDWATPLCDFLETVTVGGGTPTYDCPALSANIGDACNDNNGNTINDIVQADCSCEGTPVSPVVDCPNLNLNIGDACDDGDSNTNNDTVQSDCSCAGTPIQTGCNVTYTIDGYDITISNINAPISAVKVLDNGYGTIFDCNDWTTACNTTETITVPSAGTYFIQIQTYQDWATPLCDLLETVAISGNGGGNNMCDNVTDGGTIAGDETVCAGDDAGPITNATLPSGGSNTMEYIWLSSISGCPVNLNDQIAGATQSTYDPGVLSQTTYFKRLSRRIGCTDWFSGESNCVVKTIDNNCGGNGNTCSATYTVSGMDIIFNNISANISAAYVFDNTFATVFQCNNFGGTACNNNEVVTVPGPGTYFVQIQTYSDWANQVCNIFEEVTVTGNAQLQRNNDNTQFTAPNSLDVNTEASISDFKVFPNPAMGSVNVALEDFQDRNVEIRLVSSLGKTLKSIALQSVNTRQYEMNLASITNGIYTIVILAEGQAPVSKKLIVRRGY